MADVELLPCAECGMPCRAGEYHPFAACLMFKACHNSETVRANLAPLQAENERLRAEVERLTFEMGCLQQQYDERTAYMIVHRGSALACSDATRAAYSDEHHRADRLAEALRDAREFVAEALSDERAKFAGCLIAGDIAGIEATLQKIDAAIAKQDTHG